MGKSVQLRDNELKFGFYSRKKHAKPDLEKQKMVVQNDPLGNLSLLTVDSNHSMFDLDVHLKPRTYWLNFVFLTTLAALSLVVWQWVRVWAAGTS